MTCSKANSGCPAGENDEPQFGFSVSIPVKPNTFYAIVVSTNNPANTELPSAWLGANLENPVFGAAPPPPKANAAPPPPAPPRGSWG